MFASCNASPNSVIVWLRLLNTLFRKVLINASSFATSAKHLCTTLKHGVPLGCANPLPFSRCAIYNSDNVPSTVEEISWYRLPENEGQIVQEDPE